MRWSDTSDQVFIKYDGYVDPTAKWIISRVADSEYTAIPMRKCYPFIIKRKYSAVKGQFNAVDPPVVPDETLSIPYVHEFSGGVFVDLP